jgi:hypothetical protein
MSTEQFLDALKTVGFPITVALYFMFRSDRVISSHTKAINQLLVRLGEKPSEG